MMTLEQKYKVLYDAALDLSTTLIEAECDGLLLPRNVDDAWADLTEVLERLKKC